MLHRRHYTFMIKGNVVEFIIVSISEIVVSFLRWWTEETPRKKDKKLVASLTRRTRLVSLHPSHPLISAASLITTLDKLAASSSLDVIIDNICGISCRLLLWSHSMSLSLSGSWLSHPSDYVTFSFLLFQKKIFLSSPSHFAPSQLKLLLPYAQDTFESTLSLVLDG